MSDDAVKNDKPKETMESKLTKNERKKLRRIERRENEKEKKRLARSERVVDPMKTHDDDTSYYFDNGLRKVTPYFYTYQAFCRGRWIGREILDVISSEFRYDKDDNYATRLSAGLISVNGNSVPANYLLRNHDKLSSRVHRHEIPVTSASLKVVHEDDDFIVVDKPSSIPVHPCGRFRYNSITMLLSKELGYKNVRSIHRLDRATSGILIFVKNFAKTQEMAERVKNHDLRKEYVCRVMGEFPSTPTDGEPIVIDAPLFSVSFKIGLNRVDARGKEAQTTFERMSFNGVSSVVKCIPKTGRTHQIRVHLQYLGFPIMNDRFYNCPDLWGPKNGAGGDYGGKSDEQLIEDATAIHKVENYLEPEIYSNLLRKHRLAAEGDEDVKTEEAILNEGKGQSESKPSKKQKMDVIDGENQILKSETDALLPETLAKGEEDVKTEEAILHEGEGPSESEEGGVSTVPDIIPISSDSANINVSCGQSTTKDAGKSTSASTTSSDYDPTCKDCLQPTRDPLPKELVMFLHALRYSGPEFDFSTPLPPWAEETWNEEDEWNIF